MTADQVGLFHFTTQVSQVPEGTNIVDIGYHYVAADANGNPLVSNTNGVPDYLADANGNGLVDPGEIPWTNAPAPPPPPGPVQFTISATNQYVSTANVPLQLTIQAGVPYYIAVMLDSTNFSAASWTPYTSSNITANLGTVQGWHTVWVGLSGAAPSRARSKPGTRICLNLDLTAPILVVTNATDLPSRCCNCGGYANEEAGIASPTISPTPTERSATSLGYMTGAIFDTNSFACTNDAFKCLDLVLASGVNTVTLHAS